MNISLDKPSTTEGKIKVTLHADDYQPAVEEKVTEYRKKANLKGFRPGKVPASVIRKMYGKSILVEEVNRALSQALNNYIRDEDLNLVGEPMIDEDSIKDITWEEGAEFEFTYDVGLYTDFDVNLSKVESVTSYEIEVKDKDLDEFIANLQKQNGESSNPEVSEAGDSLYGTVTSPTNADIDETGLLDIDTLPKREQKQFIGAKADDIITFSVEKVFPNAEDLASFLGKTEGDVEGLTGELVFTVKNVNRTTPAELNQEFFDKMLGEGTVSSEDEFREHLQKLLGEQYTQQTSEYLRRETRKAVVDHVEIDLPKDFLKRWIMRSNDQGITEEQLENEFDHYISDLKWNLITSHLAKQNEIKVENADVLEHTKNMIRAQFGGQGMAMPQLEESLDGIADNYLKSENGDNYMRAFNEVRSVKIMELVSEQVKTKSKKISFDKFKELVEG